MQRQNDGRVCVKKDQQSLILGVDTGGTFTDFFYASPDGPRVLKILSTPDDPGLAIQQGLKILGLDNSPCRLIHGTTVGTNAVLEGKGARVAYITNTGFGDLLRIGRQQRTDVYALHPRQRDIPVEKENCIELNGRLDSQGEWLETPTEDDLQQLSLALDRLQPESIAINLIHGWTAPAAEILVAEHCPAQSFIVQSHQVLAEAGEYERGIVTWLQASIGPVLSRYIKKLHQQLSQAELRIMQSDGLTVSADQAAQRAVRLLLSGPAGGAAAAAYFAQNYQIPHLLTFDMGGTSSDVALVGQQLSLTTDAQIGPWPVAVPMVDIHTIGAGGGSIVKVDEAGLMQVGPESAGADPGPACYGRGGKQACVTDAHIVLGRIPSTVKLADQMELDHAAAHEAVQKIADQLALSLEACAEGIIRLANEAMSRALHVVSADRGHDPADCSLLSFGGAGGLHACELADLLGIQQVMVAPHAGVLSALGMTVAVPGRREVHSILENLSQINWHKIEQLADQLMSANQTALAMELEGGQELAHRCLLGFRYQGQQSVLQLPWNVLQGGALQQKGNGQQEENWEDLFHSEHQNRYGYRLEREIEVVDITLISEVVNSDSTDRRIGLGISDKMTIARSETVPVWSQGKYIQACLLRRECLTGQQLRGPVVIAGSDTTIWVPELWAGYQDEQGMLILKRLGT